MKKFMKIAAIVLVIAMLGCFAACGGKTETETKAPEADTPAKPVLVMATNAEFPPYEFVKDGKVVGIDAEVAQAIADKLGMELKIEDVAFESIVPGVQTGKYDMGMAGMTITPDRLKQVQFSTSYATGIQSVIIASNSSIKTIDDLEGKKIGVQTATTGDIYATGDYGEDAVTRYDNAAIAVQALKAGKIDCVIIDNAPAKAYVEENDGAVKLLDADFAVEDYAICFAKDNNELKDKVDAALKELIADGSLQKIVDKYIKK